MLPSGSPRGLLCLQDGRCSASGLPCHSGPLPCRIYQKLLPFSILKSHEILAQGTAPWPPVLLSACSACSPISSLLGQGWLWAKRIHGLCSRRTPELWPSFWPGRPEGSGKWPHLVPWDEPERRVALLRLNCWASGRDLSSEPQPAHCQVGMDGRAGTSEAHGIPLQRVLPGLPPRPSASGAHPPPG